MEFTNERLVPQNYYSHRDLYYWHISRYNFAKQFIDKKDRVLDVACGSGYGTYELAFIANEVVGIDIDQATINYAQQIFSSPNIRYICKNATDIINISKEKFDVCTSFETIEHLSEENQQLFLKNVVEILSSDGYFIVSTPNINIYSSGKASKNEFHLHELNFNEFKKILQQHFEIVFIVGQRRFDGAGIKDALIKTGNIFKSVLRRKLNNLRSGISQQISDFEFPTTDIDQCLIYIAICRRPKKR